LNSLIRSVIFIILIAFLPAVLFADNTGSLTITAKAEGNVYLNSNFIGRITPERPIVLDRQKSGDYHLRIDYAELSEQRIFTIYPDRATAVSFFLSRTGVEKMAAFRYCLKNAPLDLINVPGGTFKMGAAGGWENEKPTHHVSLQNFYMSKYEITQELFENVMGFNPADQERGWGAHFPVNNVSWYDAVQFCNKLSSRNDLDPAYNINGTSVSFNESANGFRLPTEAEWEFAASGGNRSRSYVYSGSNEPGYVGWYSDTSELQCREVGGKYRNELFLYDMSGNVKEWCWDWYEPYTQFSQTDPAGPESGVYKILRGGSWWEPFSSMRVAAREYNKPENSSYLIGFRIALADYDLEVDY